MLIDTPIETSGLILRSLDENDATEDYLSWLHDPVVNAYLEVRFNLPQSVNEIAAYISITNTSSQTLLLGIFLLDTERHIGNIKLGPIDWNHKVGDLGFLIGDRAQWGKGYASKAITLLSDYAFAQLGLAKLTAGCYADNKSSHFALKKAGFVEEGRRISQWTVAGDRQDGVLLGRVSPRYCPS